MEKIISKLPLDVQRNIIVTPTKVMIPGEIDKKDLYKNYRDLIYREELTTEKAVYIALSVDRAPYATVDELLKQNLYIGMVGR